MPLPLTHYARQALQYAEDRCAPGELTPESDHWLLLGVLGCAESRAVQLLARFGVPLPELVHTCGTLDQAGDSGYPALPTPSGSQRILDLAEEEARQRGRELVGPEHLLFALARAGGPASRFLAHYGADHARLTQAWERMREFSGEPGEDGPGGDEPPFRLTGEPVPASVGVIAAFLVLQSASGRACFLPAGAEVVPAGWPGLVLSGAHLLWSVGGLALIFPFLHLKRWAWAAVEATLFVRSGVAIALLLSDAHALLLHRGVLVELLIARALVAGWVTLLTVLLFRCRGSFRVEPGRAWTTVRREGWWALLLTLVTEAGLVLYRAIVTSRL